MTPIQSTRRHHRRRRRKSLLRNPRLRKLLLLLAAGAAVALAGLALVRFSGPNAEKSLAAAKAHLAKNEPQAALIELKNSLQAQPASAEARFLLGRTLLERDDPVGAAVELRKAHDLNHPADQVVPALAKAYVQTGEWRKVIELDSTSVLRDPEAMAALKTQLAYAHGGLGDSVRAEAALNAALEAAPQHAPAQLLRARQVASKGDVAAAQQVVAEVLTRAPANVDALLLSAELQLVKGETDAAMDGFRKVLAARPDHVAAHDKLLSHLLAKPDLPAAKTQLEALQKARPRHPQTLYYAARLAAQQGDLKAADENVQPLLKALPDSPQVLELAGIVALQKGELEQAERQLGKLVQVAPRAALARQMLARVALRRGDPARALAALQPLLDVAQPDATTLSLAGTARAQAGEIKLAEELFARAAKQNPDDARPKTALALTRLARGDAAGLEQLEAIAAAGDDSADVALINAGLARRNFDAALQAADRLVAKHPGKPGPLQMRGQVLLAKGDLAGARAGFEKAAAADPKFFPAIQGLAGIDLREGKPEAARARVDAALKAEPNHAQALLVLAALDERAKKPASDVAAGIAKAVAAKPGDPTLRVRLVNYHLEKRDTKAALAAAQEAESAMPNDPQVVDALARAQFSAGAPQQAIATFNRLAGLRPRAVEPLLDIAAIHSAGKDNAAALETLKRALALAPDHPLVNRRAAAVMLAEGKGDEALALARSLAARRPELALGDELQGDVHAQQRRFAEAATAYRAALRKQPGSPLAVRLHSALVAAGSSAQAETFVQSWLKDRPKDTALLMYLGTAAIAGKDFLTAESRFKQALAGEPDNPALLNNLAWAMHELKRPGALKFAQRANELQPDVPTIMDTLAATLADAGDMAKALDVQRRALEMAPEAHALRFNLARLHVKAGNKDAARQELDKLKALGEKFPGHREVEQLLGSL